MKLDIRPIIYGSEPKKILRTLPELVYSFSKICTYAASIYWPCVALRWRNFFGSGARRTLKSCLLVTPATAPAWLLLSTPAIGEAVSQVPSVRPYSPTTLTFGSLILMSAVIVSFVGSAVLVQPQTGRMPISSWPSRTVLQVGSCILRTPMGLP